MKFLMCKPDHYGIEYEINPWMNIKKNANKTNAIHQWENLYHTMLHCGAEVKLIESKKGWPDMVFTANGGLYYQQKIILPHFKHPERQGELPYLQKWFQEEGYSLLNFPVATDSPNFEGAGDALLAGNLLFVGYGFRTTRRFYETASYFNQDNLVYCELVNPYFYHIDTCFCPLNDTLAIWFPPAFSQASQEIMSKKIELLAVNEEEASRFACNAVVINNHVIIPADCPHLTALLEEKGFMVHACDMSEFLKAGGACKCLTLRID